jgi:site-specific DNA-methyltransferase (adenine-specific)
MADAGLVQAYGDEGGASRYFTTFAPFFYTPKADRSDRELGCAHLPVKSGAELTGRTDGADGLKSPRAGTGRGGGRRNTHPTVKSTDLMRWLVRLITPPGGLVLDMFAGSGSTGVACSAEGARFIGIEAEPESVEIARARIVGDAPLFNAAGMR